MNDSSSMDRVEYLTKKSHSLFSTLGTFKYTSSKLGIEALILSLYKKYTNFSSRWVSS